MSDYVNFLSFCFGVQLTPSVIRIDRLSFAQMMRAVEKHEYSGDHEVHYVWPELEVDNRDLALMMTCFGLKDAVSSERLLNACRWLEEIPIAKAQPVLSSSDAILSRATAKGRPGRDASPRKDLVDDLRDQFRGFPRRRIPVPKARWPTSPRQSGLHAANRQMEMFGN